MRVPPPVVCLCALGLGLGLASACRNAKEGDVNSSPIAPNTAGVNGCSGADQAFTSGQTPVVVALATLDIGPHSRLTAAAGAELLYATGDGAQVVAIDLAGPAPVETELVADGTVAALLALEGVAGTPQLSGLAVLDADTLLVVEHASNTILSVDRTTPDTVGFFAGQPDAVPGFADGAATGPAGLARFSFGAGAELCPSGELVPRVFVTDPGNHAVRVVEDGFVVTLAGRGFALYVDGELDGAAFDTPSGLSVTCDDRLLVTERGGNGFGQRLRALSIGGPNPFGGFFGAAATLVGDGGAATSGGPSLAGAQVAGPQAPLVSSSGEIYWVDAETGVLRRRQVDGECDCPLHDDCASAVLTPDFPAGNAISLARTAGGDLYALDATAGVFYRVTP